jgi:hypothetical protein
MTNGAVGTASAKIPRRPSIVMYVCSGLVRGMLCTLAVEGLLFTAASNTATTDVAADAPRPLMQEDTWKRVE